MDFREIFLAQHARAHAASTGGGDPSTQDQILRDVTPELARVRPLHTLGSLAWQFWHMSRGEDIGVNFIIANRPQVIDEPTWAERLGIGRRELGTGMTGEEVDDFNERIDYGALLDYRAAVGRQTIEVVRSLPPEVLDEPIDAALVQRAREAGVFGPNAEWVPKRWLGKPKSFTLMHTVLSHSYLHLGQADVIRGLLGLPTF